MERDRVQGPHYALEKKKRNSTWQTRVAIDSEKPPSQRFDFSSLSLNRVVLLQRELVHILGIPLDLQILFNVDAWSNITY